MTEVKATKVFDRLLRKANPSDIDKIIEALHAPEEDPIVGKLLRGYHAIKV